MDFLIKMLVSAVIGTAVLSTASVVYDIITKSNIAEKIKEVFFKKRTTKDIKESDTFAAMVKEKEKNSVNVDVFFGNSEALEIERITLMADEVDDDIEEGDWIILKEDNDDISIIDTYNDDVVDVDDNVIDVDDDVVEVDDDVVEVDDVPVVDF